MFYPPQELIQSLGFDTVEWDVSSEKQQLVIYRRDRSLHLLIHTKKVNQDSSLATCMHLVSNAIATPLHTAGSFDLQSSDSTAGAVYWSQPTGLQDKHHCI